MVRVTIITATGERTIAEQGRDGYEILGAKIRRELNSVSSAVLTFPATNDHVKALKNLNAVIAVYDDLSRVFIGQVGLPKSDIWGNIEISADGALSWLSNIVKAPFVVERSANLSVADYLTRIINQYNDGADSTRKLMIDGITVDGTVDVNHHDEYTNTLDLLREVINSFGGYLFESAGTLGKLPSISYIKNPVESKQVLVFGVNERSLEDVLDFSDYASRVYGVGKDGITAYAIDAQAESMFGRRDYAIKSNAETVEELTEEVESVLATKKTPVRSMTLSAADLAGMNHTYKAFNVGTIATAKDRKLGLDVDLIVNSTERDLINRMESTVIFGKPPVSVARILAKRS